MFDLFQEGRHKYTFQNMCLENPNIALEDGVRKIFLNTQSIKEDVNKGLRAFLDYVSGKEPKDTFTEKLEEAVQGAKQNRKWRHEYMTLLMRDQENIEKGIEQGAKQVNDLNMILLEQNRTEDLKRAAWDKEYQLKLMRELL